MTYEEYVNNRSEIFAKFAAESENLKKTTLSAYCRENGLEAYRQREIEMFTKRLVKDERIREAWKLTEKPDLNYNPLAVIAGIADAMLDNISEGTDVAPYYSENDSNENNTAKDIMFYRAVLEIPGAYTEFLNEIGAAVITELNETGDTVS